MIARAKELAPYLIALGAGIYFFDLAEHFQFPSISGRIGPDAWPKLVLGLLCAVCVFEILRRLIAGPRVEPVGASAEAGGVIQQDADLEAQEGPSHPGLVAGAVVATVCYLLILETTGFVLTTFVYMAILMWLGGFRRFALMLPLSAAASLVFMFLFMRIIFVALPLGVEPFARVSIALMTAMGIH